MHLNYCTESFPICLPTQLYQHITTYPPHIIFLIQWIVYRMDHIQKGFPKNVYSHQLTSPWPWNEPRLLHMHDDDDCCLINTLVTAEVIISDRRGSFYYFTSDLLNSNVYKDFEKPNPHFSRVNLVEIAGGGGSCVRVGTINEQFGPSMNNNFILVQIDKDQPSKDQHSVAQYSEGLRNNAITIYDLMENCQMPEAHHQCVYSVQSGGMNVFSQPLTGSQNTKLHYIKKFPETQLVAMHFREGVGYGMKTLGPGDKGTKRTLRSNDAGLWVRIQGATEPRSGATPPRPGKPGCRLLGHVACINDTDIDGTDGEVLVQPFSDILEGLAECLG